MKAEAAERLALEGLVFLAERPEAMEGFLGAAGADAGDLRKRAAEPEFLGFVLDFLLSDERLLMDFCDASGIAYDRPMQARMFLPGGDLPNWT